MTKAATRRSRMVTFGIVAFLAVPHPVALAGGVVAADHPAASACGAEILSVGGNAADAAAAAALCAGVVQPAGSGLGGGGFAVVRLRADETAVLDFRERAPAAAHRDLFRRPDGTIDEQASKTGGLAVAVPTESRGLAALVLRHGRLPLAAVAAPAIRLARDGFVVGDHLAASLRGVEGEVLAELGVDGRPPVAGEVLVRPELALTLAKWARTRGEHLQRGAGARAIARHVAARGGVMVRADLAAATVAPRTPLVVRWGDRTVVTMPPPSSGGIVLAQVLAALDPGELRALGWNTPAYLHRLAETFQHAYADRANFLGDPDFVEVPLGRLLSPERIGEIRGAFDPSRTLPASAYGPPVAPPIDAGTQHISAVDGEGGAVALTTTINTAFGAELVVPGLGVLLNDEMDDFSVAPGVPNAYGLVGNAANAVAAGKRPLSSMTPTIVLDAAGRVELVVGASGGSTIPSATVQVLLAILLFDQTPEAAVAAPRIHHQWTPQTLFVEPGFPEATREALAALGHRIVVRPAFSAVQAVRVGGGGATGGSDPRKGGAPASAR